MTKRQLGYLFMLAGFGASVGLFVMDFIGAGQFQGIGPAQRLALIVAGAVFLLGASLLPLGDNPA